MSLGWRSACADRYERVKREVYLVNDGFRKRLTHYLACGELKMWRCSEKWDKLFDLEVAAGLSKQGVVWSLYHVRWRGQWEDGMNLLD